MERWLTTWSYAQRCTVYTYWKNQNSFKITVRNNLYGSAVRLKFSNMYNFKTIKVKQASLLIANEERDVTGSYTMCTDFDVHYGQDIYSGIVEADVRPGLKLQVEVIFAGFDNPMTGNTFESYVAMVLQGVEILSGRSAVVLGCFGDSLTHQGKWTTPFFRQLYARFPGKISAFEVGINGNRLLRDSEEYRNTLGLSGVHRLKHDVMSLQGLTHVILALGTNDIGLPGTQKTPMTDMPSLEEMKKAYQEMAEKLKRMEVRVIAAAITPRNWDCSCVEQRENLRLRFNDWIRGVRIFDEVYDFSTILSKDGRSGLKREYDAGDGIHINENAGLKLLEAIRFSI